MIEINLLPGKKRAVGARFKFAVPDFRGILANIKDPWLLGAVAAWLLVGGGSVGLFFPERAKLASLDSRLGVVKSEKRRFDAIIAQKRQSEKIRDSLVAEITIIRNIDADRYIWPHVLDQVTKALPPYTWLNEVAAAVPAPAQPGGGAPGGQPAAEDITAMPTVRVYITGRTVDIQAYTTFLRQLAASPWLTDVTAATSQTIIETDRPVTAFTITARYHVADSVYIRTVPLLQSVR